MATKKNTCKSNRAAAISSDPLGDYGGLMKQIDGLFGLKKETWAEFDKFLDEQGPTLTNEYGLEEGDLDGGLGMMAWIASLAKEAERGRQAQVDTAIQYLDPSPSV